MLWVKAGYLRYSQVPQIQTLDRKDMRVTSWKGIKIWQKFYKNSAKVKELEGSSHQISKPKAHYLKTTTYKLVLKQSPFMNRSVSSRWWSIWSCIWETRPKKQLKIFQFNTKAIQVLDLWLFRRATLWEPKNGQINFRTRISKQARVNGGSAEIVVPFDKVEAKILNK